MKERVAERIEGLIVGRKRDGRSIYSSAGKRALIHACLQPGISVAGSALANGINANLLRKWIQQHQSRQRSGKTGAASNNRPAPILLPVNLSESRLLPSLEHDEPTALEPIKPVDAQSNQIEIDIAGAKLTLRGSVDARQLRLVLACLTQR